MINAIVQQLTEESLANVEVASITAFASVLVAAIGIFTARYFTHPKTPISDPDEHRNKHESILSSYTGDQNEFISLVIKDSKDLHARLDKNDAVIDQMRRERTEIVGAFGRYIQKLARAWGSGGKMPYPDNDDMALLEDTLPADWRRRKL